MQEFEEVSVDQSGETTSKRPLTTAGDGHSVGCNWRSRALRRRRIRLIHRGIRIPGRGRSCTDQRLEAAPWRYDRGMTAEESHENKRDQE
jgi:hypothetical protein